MATGDQSIEHELTRVGLGAELEVEETDIALTAGDDGSIVRIALRLPEEDVESLAFGLIYVLGVLSFADARPRGVSGEWFDDDDQWAASDMLRGLEFAGGRLRWYADYVRGRCIKTSVEIDARGKVLVETINRGEAALRWIDRLQGKSYLQAVE